MATKNPFTFLSYAHPVALENRLNEMCDAHIIRYWHFVNHLGEPKTNERKYQESFGNIPLERIKDENGNDIIQKNHRHVYVEPNKSIDTMEFCERMILPDDDGTITTPDVKDIREKTNFEHAFYYFAHNPEYILAHNWACQRDASNLPIIYTHLNYPFEDFGKASESGFDYRLNNTLMSMQSSINSNIVYLLRSGATPVELLSRGLIKRSEYFSISLMYKDVNYYEKKSD